MPVLNIEGRRVTVDDSFLALSPEQQNATVDEIAASIGIRADTVAAPSQSTPPSKEAEGGRAGAQRHRWRQ